MKAPEERSWGREILSPSSTKEGHKNDESLPAFLSSLASVVL